MAQQWGTKEPPCKILAFVPNFAGSFFVSNHTVSTVRSLSVTTDQGRNFHQIRRHVCTLSHFSHRSCSSSSQCVFWPALSSSAAHLVFICACAGAAGSPISMQHHCSRVGWDLESVFLSARLIAGPDLQSCLYEILGCSNCISRLDWVCNDVFLCHKMKVWFQHE